MHCGSRSCCVLFLSYSVEEEEVNCLGDPRGAGTVFADGPPYSWKLNDAMMMRLMRGQVLKIQILASEKLCGLIALNLKF